MNLINKFVERITARLYALIRLNSHRSYMLICFYIFFYFIDIIINL